MDRRPSMLDTTTLLVTDIVVVFALAASLQFYRAHRKTYPGFSRWIVGSWLMGLGFLAMIGRPVTGELLGVFVSNAAFVGAAIARLDGTLRFTSARAISPRWYVLALVAGVLSLSSAVFPSAAARSLVSAVGVGVPSSVVGWLFVRGTPLVRATPYRVIGVLHFVFALGLVSRAVGWVMAPHLQLLGDSLLHALFFVSFGVFEGWWSIAFTMMNADRIEAELRDSEEKLSSTVSELRAAVGEVRTLSGLLPICCSCAKIRDDKGYWEELKDYLQVRQGVMFTHGICPECRRKLYPEYDDD